MKIFRKNAERKRGVTLVELVISVLILGIILSALLGSFVMARIGLVKAKHYIEAMNHARAALEAYLHDGTTSYIITTGELASLNGACSVTTSNYSSDLDEVTVTVSWTERSIGTETATTVTEQLTTLIED